MSGVIVSCDSNMTKNTAPISGQYTIERATFGQLSDGTDVDLYTLRKDQSLEAGIITYGGILQSLKVVDAQGGLDDVVLGFDSLQGYHNDHPYFGAIIGRYGNRIAGGKFTLDDQTYTLATNNDPNHLHGGTVGFDKVVWDARVDESQDIPKLVLSYLSKDGEEGYPGNLACKVSYSLTEQNGLLIEYHAVTDKATVLNLTNHSYFNLGDDPKSILDHELQIDADHYLPIDEHSIPLGELVPVQDTPFDFREAKLIGKDIALQNEQLVNGTGYDHCWVIDNPDSSFRHIATASTSSTGIVLQVWTTEPGVQLYTGNFLDGIIGKGGTNYLKRSAFCLETQHYPDSPNQSHFPSTVLRPGEVYESVTEYRFGKR